MNRHMFQPYAEQSKRGQFQSTALLHSKKEIDLLEPLFENMQTPSLQKPTKPFRTEGDDGADEDLYKEEIKTYVKDKKNLDATLRSLFNVVWGQCSITLKNKLKSKAHFKSIKQDKDIAELLKQIKGIMHQFESHISIYEALNEAKNFLSILPRT